jgi:hypothetical protein
MPEMTAERSGPSRAGGMIQAKGNITGRRSGGNAGREQAVARGAASRARSPGRQDRQMDFVQVNRAALAVLLPLLGRWLPGGRIEGAEYVVRNPKRHDQQLGSFKINLVTGRWGDFAIGAKGGDTISLAAYLADCSQLEAARRLAAVLGLSASDHAGR